MVDRRNYLIYLSASLNHRRSGGRVPQKAESLGFKYAGRVFYPWRYGSPGPLDVSECSGLGQKGVGG